MCNLHWCYTFCTGVTLFALVLRLNCTALSQSESSNFLMYIINRKTCNLYRPVLFLLYLACFVSHFRHSLSFEMCRAIHHYIILLFHFHHLGTSKPLEGWSARLKYYFRYTALC